MYGMGVSLATGQDYERGVGILRDVVGHGRDRDAWLRGSNPSVANVETVRVQIHAPYTPDTQINVYLRTCDLYVIGVENKRAAFYFSDSLMGRMIGQQVMLGFTGHYSDLGSFVSIGKLNTARIDAAVAAIAAWTPSTVISSRVSTLPHRSQNQSEDVRHLLVLILILAEAARFHEVSATVRNAIAGTADTPLTLAAIDALVHEWGKRSASDDAAGVAVRAGR
jgi:hypothetical protein